MIPIIPIGHPAGESAPINPDAPLIGDKTLSGLSNPPPLALYIHIPWCVRKCPYCDFNSHELKQSIPEEEYVAALIADLEQSTPLIWGRKISSVFFGGGTPSLFSAAAIDKILSAVRMLTPLEYDAEITLEANPGTVDVANFKGYREAGVNRISLGIQSFNARHLQALGRIHDPQQALAAAELALSLFQRVNLDLMYGLPQQTLAEALQDAQTALQLKVQHYSFYHLTLEPNTPFHRNPPAIPDDDSSAEMQQAIEDLLQQHGYQHYETSAFAQANQACRHNLNYWTFGDYLGIGAGAHSKLSMHDKIIRQSRHKHPKQYLQHASLGSAIDAEWRIDDLPFEFMMNALRLIDGFDLALFEQRCGLPISHLSQAIRLAEKKQLLKLELDEQKKMMLQPTLLGQRFLNDLLQLFMQPAD